MPKSESGAERVSAEATAPRDLLERFRRTRAASVALAAPLSAEDQCVQSMPDASPAKWHLAHTTWFFETFVLAPHAPGYSRHDGRYGFLFNSYYEAVGPRHPRPQRGLLTRPTADEVLAYRRHVDTAMERLLEGGAPGLGPLIELGLSHEEQHQELLLTDILHLFAQSPLSPAYSRTPEGLGADPGPMGFVDFPGGVVRVGHEGAGFAFDNESPAHEVLLQPYRLADRLVTNAEWLGFVEDDGYARPELWLADGWALAQAEGWRAPLYWSQNDEGAWCEMTLLGARRLDLHAPVAHVSFYEAEAYATWSGARLPTEFEWENAARDLPVRGNFLSRGRLMTAAASPGAGLRQMFGDVWEWTRSAYQPYPGFKPGDGAIGEYNGKFMSGQMVLRGGACVTPAGHTRASYRNFFHPEKRWMFAGVRLAKDGTVRAEQPASDFARDVIAGLSASPKTLPSKHFYDAEGSRLFEEITELPEYYPTRTEAALLEQVAHEIAAEIPPRAALIEYGSGASTKTRLLLDAAPQVAVYMPVDISETALAEASERLREAYPSLRIEPLTADFTAALASPDSVRDRPRVGFFPGSTIGNFPPGEAVAFLKRARRFLGEGGRFIVGLDLVKDEATLVSAYDDAAGVTAAFNKNLLARVNRELGGDVDLDTFDHRALWNAAESRMEMRLVSKRRQDVCAAGRAFHFEPGETIHTENSYKFTLEGFGALAEAAGWRLIRSWTSAAPAFAIVLLG